MSETNCEPPAGAAKVMSGDKPSTSFETATSGLNSIVLALEELQRKEPIRKIDHSRPTVEETKMPPIPHGINSAKRVVSTDSIGESDTDSTPPQLPPQVKEGETTSSPAKVSDTTSDSAPAETSSQAVPSPQSPSSPSPAIVADDGPTSTDDASKAADFSEILADPEAWLLKTENMFCKLPPVDRSSDNDIVVQPNDVLCGRGGETNHHPGNIRYRSLVKAYQKLYLLAKRRDKPKIAQCIVVSVRGVNGRFLKRTKNANQGSSWVDVGNVKAREKTSQALREGAPNLRENVNPPVATSPTNDSTAVNARQVLVPDQAEGVTAPAPANVTLPPSAPTALEAMMGWRMPGAGFNNGNSTTNANGPIPSAPPVSSLSSLSQSDADTDALTAQVFTKAASQLMAHPAFHQLDPARQQEAILFELKNAKAAVESAKRNSTSPGTTPSANIHDQGRTSPMIPTAPMSQQQTPQSQQHHQPYPNNGYPQYHHGQHPYYLQMHGTNYYGNTTNPEKVSSMDMKLKLEQAKEIASEESDVQKMMKLGMDMKLKLDQAKEIASKENDIILKMYREVIASKAALVAGSSSGIASANENDQEAELRRKMNKRPAPSSSPTSSLSVRPSAVVSDSGSDISSSSSCASSVDNIAVKIEKTEAVTSVSRGGSRLKRLKLRMKSDFN